MSSAACVFTQCSTSSAVADSAEVICVSTTPPHGSPPIDLWLSEIDFDSDLRQEQAIVRSPAACGRKTLDEILAGVSPKNPDMPRKLDEALELKQHEEYVRKWQNADDYDMVILSTRGDHEHLDEETKKKCAPRQNACDIPSRIWQWLKIAV